MTRYLQLSKLSISPNKQSRQKQRSRSCQRLERCFSQFRDLIRYKSKISADGSIFKIAEGGAPETPVPAAVNMAGNNNDYFYENAARQEDYDDDDFWGAPEPGIPYVYGR